MCGNNIVCACKTPPRRRAVHSDGRGVAGAVFTRYPVYYINIVIVPSIYTHDRSMAECKRTCLQLSISF